MSGGGPPALFDLPWMPLYLGICYLFHPLIGLTATVGALTGLIFGSARTVGQVLGNAALSIALTTIGSAAVTVATGIIVWLWMERLFRAGRVSAERDVEAA